MGIWAGIRSPFESFVSLSTSKKMKKKKKIDKKLHFFEGQIESVAFHFAVPQILRLWVKERRKTWFVFSKFFFHFSFWKKYPHWFCQCFFSVLFLSLDLKGRLHFFYHSAQRCSCTTRPHQYLMLLDDVLSCKGVWVPQACPWSWKLLTVTNVKRDQKRSKKTFLTD